MILYNISHFIFRIILFVILFMNAAYTQDESVIDQSQPQNLVPEVEDGIDISNEDNNVVKSIDDSKSIEVTVTELPKLSPSWIGVLSDQDNGLGWNMWEGTDANFVNMLLELLPVDAPSPAMRSLAKRLLLTNAAIPNEEKEEGLIAISPNGEPIKTNFTDNTFLSIRFAKLASLGEKVDLFKLYNQVPPDKMVDSLAKGAMYARLISGDTNKACDEIIGISKRTNDISWKKGLIVCHLILGKREDALLNLELFLAELDDDKFSRLIYSIADGYTIEKFDKGNIYYKILISLMPGEQLDKQRLNLEPSGLKVVAENNLLTLKVRILSAEKAVSAGVLDSNYLGKLAVKFNFDNTIFARAASESKNMEGYKARALLLIASGSTTSIIERARVLGLLWDNAEKEGLYSAYAAASLPILSTIRPRPDLLWFASSAAKASISSGDYSLASEWLALLGKSIDLDFEASGSLLRLLPLIAIAGQELPKPFSNEQATDVWSGLSDSYTRIEKEKIASRLLVILNAMGIEIKSGTWKEVISPNNILVSENIPSTAFRYQLHNAAQNNRKGEVVAISLVMLGQDGPNKAGLVALNAVIRALRSVGLDQDARAIAVEAAISSVN